eukprot:2583782-Karenia_brevis.AAC.1
MAFWWVTGPTLAAKVFQLGRGGLRPDSLISGLKGSWGLLWRPRGPRAPREQMFADSGWILSGFFYGIRMHFGGDCMEYS